MHDTFLLNKLSKEIIDICQKNEFRKITEVQVIVNPDSHVNETSLLEELKANCPELISENIDLKIQRKKIEALTAIIQCIEGEK
jgi:Zn finger protein HypA/HybF involved in hydrogenase expression